MAVVFGQISVGVMFLFFFRSDWLRLKYAVSQKVMKEMFLTSSVILKNIHQNKLQRKYKLLMRCIIYMKILLQMDWCLMIGIMFTSSAKDYQTGKTRLVNIEFAIVSPRL